MNAAINLNRQLTAGEKEVLERLQKCGGSVTTCAPGPTYLARRLWSDNTLSAQDERVRNCVALIQLKRIKWHPSATESTAVYRCATSEEREKLRLTPRTHAAAV